MIGTVCYAIESGLGYQAKAFIDNGLIDKILVVPHSSYPEQKHWHEGKRVRDFEELLDTCSTIVFFETPFQWPYITRARERKVKTVLMAMYECTRYPLPYYPDVLVGGSAIETKHYKIRNCAIPCTHINVPVDMKWKLRTKAHTFIHNAGHGGLGGRNGTMEVLEAMKRVRSPLKLIIRSQNGGIKSDDPRITIINGSVPYETLWEEGDIMIFPEKFGGSFLPMQEAFASGMPVMASDRFPTNIWLPQDLLIPVAGYKTERIGSDFDMAILDTQQIANKMDFWYDKDISKYSLMGKKWAEKNSWEVLKKEYEKIFN